MRGNSNRFEGIGEFQFPGDSALEHGRRLFFDALVQVEPEVLRSLVAGPYQVALKSGIDLSAETPSSRGQLTAAVRKVRKAAKAWCARWGLVDPWCVDLAHDTALGWLREPERKGSWAEEAWEWIHEDSFPRWRDLKFEFRGWRMVRKTWKDFEAAALASYEKYLDEYRREAELGAATHLGLVRTKTKRQPDHFLWLARHVLRRETPSEIARFSADASADSVRKAIGRLARDIDLTLRTRHH